NSSIFGLGNPAGTVNMVASTGNLRRKRTKVELRGDSFGGVRQTLDAYRALIKDKLAIRFGQVYMHTAYKLKPSGTHTQGYSLKVKYQPFPTTVLTASYLAYRMDGNRPNSIMPRDATQDWRENISTPASPMPLWDPVTNTAYAPAGNVIPGTPTTGN